MSFTKDRLIDEMARDEQLDAEYDEWLAGLTSMESERFARAGFEGKATRLHAPERHLVDTSHHEPVPLSDEEKALVAEYGLEVV